MGRSLLSWWESLAPRRQVGLSSPVLMIAIFGFHEAFFPLLEWTQSALYALMEGVPVALLVTYATQIELTRRAGRHGEERDLPTTPVEPSTEQQDDLS